MSTSDRTVIAEAAVAAALVIGPIVAVSPDDVWLGGLGLHPMWIAVIVMAARYGARGLLPALGITLAGLIASSMALGGSMSGMTARAESPSDLIALATGVVVAWVSMLHEGRIARAAQKLEEVSEAHGKSEEQVRSLQNSLVYMRGRLDRLDMSLSLWRNLASRLERGSATDAARAVLELAEVRVGAQAGTVHLRDGDRLTTLAGRGAWSTPSRPHQMNEDSTIRAAIQSKRVTPAAVGASEHDSDLAIPVVDDDTGVVIGVIALRGVSPTCMKAADLRDLGVIAQWLAPSVARQLRRQFGQALVAFQAAAPRKQVSL